ncbi:hypothetical protein HPB52_008326 [Rhipicephalus sanguineus]|uniref:Uncharacterized protein n=1 Tax=Rhipicephalus sanguineus TaxID=34632 RepID=A0A9D4QJ12_RHISA|nr:hypothetical protein HPB52_008326 [Rhipicephalus sanguineus]
MSANIAVASLLTATVFALLGCALASKNVWILSQQEMEGDGCDFRAYEKTRNACEDMFSNVDVVTSGNNTCSNVQIYITCVKDAMRKTLCSANDTIKENENARIMINVRKKNVTCIPKAAPQNMRQTMSCQRSIALKKFFACSSTFHYYMKNKDDLLPAGGGTDCSVVSGYKDCVQLGLRHSDCGDDKDFIDHVHYFMRNDIVAFAKPCQVDTNSPATNITALKTCDEDKAIDTYLTCAKKFFDNVDSEELRKVSKISSKTKVGSRLMENGIRSEDLTTKTQTKIDPCTSNLKFEMCVAQAMRESRCLHERMKIMHHLKYLEEMNSCVDVVKKSTGCDRDGEIFNHVSPILHSLTHEYDRACRNVTNSFRMSFVQMKSQENCVRQRVLKKMFVCGLSFSNLFDEMEPRSESGNPVKCKLLIDYEQCIAKASRGTGCDEDAEMRVQIMSFSDIMRDEYKDSCPNVVYKNAPEAPEAFEDYEEDWADSDPYWYDTKEGAEGQAGGKGRRASAPVVKTREDPFGNVRVMTPSNASRVGADGNMAHQRMAKERILQERNKPGTLRQVAGPGQNSSNDMDLSTFLRREPRTIYNTSGKRRVRIEKEYLDDSPAAMASYGLGGDYKEDYVDDSFARFPSRRMGLRYRAQQRRSDPNAWVSSRRAMKILDDEEQQEDDDIMGLMRRKRKRSGSDAVRRMSKDLQCNLKQLKRQSETCDRTFSDSIKVSWSKDWPAPASSSSSTPAKDVQEKLCNSLVTYRTCLLETAKRMHCGEIAGKVAVVVEEQMKKLGVAFCGAPSLRLASWMAIFLSVALTFRQAQLL